nr:MAG TPA: hypothetical protein [Caudoviricetes sp.]
MLSSTLNLLETECLTVVNTEYLILIFLFMATMIKVELYNRRLILYLLIMMDSFLL